MDLNLIRIIQSLHLEGKPHRHYVPTTLRKQLMAIIITYTPIHRTKRKDLLCSPYTPAFVVKCREYAPKRSYSIADV